MARFIEIVDPTDPRLRDYVALRETQLRHALEHQHGLYIAEGEKVIRRALEAGHRPRSLLLAPRWVDRLTDHLEGLDVDVYLGSEALVEQVTGFHVHRGALASMHRPEPRGLTQLRGASRVVVCQDIVDHANLGAIIRSAAALGWDAVVLSPTCADPLYRRAIKTAMGTVFDLPWVRLRSDHELVRLREAGFTLVAAALTDDAITLDDFSHQFGRDGGRDDRSIALLLGTEGHGLTREWLDAADQVVSIPMADGVDSLNVAAAAAVLCWELRPPQ